MPPNAQSLKEIESQRTGFFAFQISRLVTPKVLEDGSKTVLHTAFGADIKWVIHSDLSLTPLS